MPILSGGAESRRCETYLLLSCDILTYTYSNIYIYIYIMRVCVYKDTIYTHKKASFAVSL